MIPQIATSFDTFNLLPAINQALKRLTYEVPTPIQAQTIPISLSGSDILATAQTGSGKTLAFAVPVLTKLLENPSNHAMIMTPTRELAEQVRTVFHKLLTEHKHIKSALLIGGVSIMKQFSDLKARPQLIIGTPGRINDHLVRGTLQLKQTTILVLDEADRMLDMGFGVQLDAIGKFLPKERQTLMFSATLPKSIKQLSQRFLRDPQRIDAGTRNEISKNLKQDILHISEEAKFGKLVEELKIREGTVLIFVNAKYKTEKLAEKLTHELRADNMFASAMHGDLRQNQRQKVLANFRNKKFRILVATDVAARGLDIPHIEHVINYDLPQSPEDYIHRIGRTARAGAEGSALCFVSGPDKAKWRAIQQLLKGEDIDGPAFLPAEPKKFKTRDFKSRDGGFKFKRSAGGSGGRGRSNDSSSRGDRPFGRDKDKPASRDGAFSRDRAPRRDGAFARDKAPSRDGEFARDRAPSRDGAFARDRAPSRDGAFARDRAPSRDGAFARDRAPARDGAFARDRAPARDGAFARDKAPARDGAFARDKAPARDGVLSRNKPAGKTSAFAKDQPFGKKKSYGKSKPFANKPFRSDKPYRAEKKVDE